MNESGSNSVVEANRWSRRHFLGSAVLAAAAVSSDPAFAAEGGTAPARKLKLGFDNFAVRDLGYSAEQLIDYAAKLRVDSLFISDLKPFSSTEEGYLRDLRAKAAAENVQIYLGSWSICPSSKSFRKDWGTAEEHLALGIRMAKALGSPAFRVILGNGDDRKSEGGIQARIADTVRVCKSARRLALDSGVKIAVENHAGDMQARELARLIEAAGPDYVGANLDSGNATWTMEDPFASLEILGPYAVCTSLRDSMIWESAHGATIQWTAMGEGLVDWVKYFERFAQLCPSVPVHLETISGFNREIPYLKDGFWAQFPDMPASEFARFLAIAKKGKPMEPFQVPAGKDRKAANQEYQRDVLESSLAYCRKLGLGLKA